MSNDGEARLAFEPLVSDVVIREYLTIEEKQPSIGKGNMFFVICCPVCKEQLTLLEGTSRIPAHGTGACALLS